MTLPVRTHDVAVGDVVFHLSESGPPGGEPVVLLHGSGPGATALSNWEHVMGKLGDELRCVAPDIVGFGGSTHPDPPPQGIVAFTTLRVATLLALLDTLGLDRVTLVGNSMGGLIALKLAQEAPERVNALVLMGAAGAPVPPTPGLLRLITFYDAPTAENMAELLTCFVHDPARLGADLATIAGARLPLALRPEIERSHRATFAPGSGSLGLDEAAVAAITHPVTLLHGDDDRIIPLAASEWYAGCLPNARLEVFERAGHWLQIEQPERFVALVRSAVQGPG